MEQTLLVFDWFVRTQQQMMEASTSHLQHVFHTKQAILPLTTVSQQEQNVVKCTCQIIDKN